MKALRPRDLTGRPRDLVAAVVAAVVLLAMMTTFAIELTNTQARDRADVRARVHERGVLAAALIDGLFATATQQSAQNDRLYGGARVPAAALDRHVQADSYLAVLGPDGRILAASSRLPASVQQTLSGDLSVRLATSGSPYGLGNVRQTPLGAVLNFAVPFDTRYGRRILVTGFQPALLGAFLGGDLRKIPRVRGADSYIVDGNGVIIASTSLAQPVGSQFGGLYPATPQRNFARDTGRRYVDAVELAGSRWRVVLDSPDGPLYASVSGLTKWLPWVIFGAFALVGMLAFFLVAKIFAAAAETRAANRRLAELNHELEGSNAMLALRAAELARSNEELDQFAQVASHDLQEPLRKVRTFTEQLTRIEGDRLSDKGQDYLRRANAAAERMQTLIEDLLRFSRVTTQVRAPVRVELEEVVAAVLDDLSSTIEQSGAQVHVGPLPALVAEPLQMRQLMQNLISNALKFRHPGRSPELWIDGQTDGSEVRLTVRDNGIGFDPRHRERIFRVFERLHGRSEYAGTGIGLALCRKIAERHGGTVVADAQLGEGATFTVTLPCSRPGPSSATPVDPDRRLSLEEAHV